MNHVESGTSSIVLTFTAGVSRRSPGLQERVLGEVVAVAALDRRGTARVEGPVVVHLDRVVGIEARRGAAADGQQADGRQHHDAASSRAPSARRAADQL